MPTDPQPVRYRISQLDETEPTRCPCGWTRRAFAVPDNHTATVHLLSIATDVRTHYHKTLTEIYAT